MYLAAIHLHHGISAWQGDSALQGKALLLVAVLLQDERARAILYIAGQPPNSFAFPGVVNLGGAHSLVEGHLQGMVGAVGLLLRTHLLQIGNVEELPCVILRPAVGGSHLRELCVVITVGAVVLVRIVLVVGKTLSLDVGEHPLHRVIDGVVCSVGCAGVGVDLSGEGVGLSLLTVSHYEGGALGAHAYRELVNHVGIGAWCGAHAAHMHSGIAGQTLGGDGAGIAAVDYLHKQSLAVLACVGQDISAVGVGHLAVLADVSLGADAQLQRVGPG